MRSSCNALATLLHHAQTCRIGMCSCSCAAQKQSLAAHSQSLAGHDGAPGAWSCNSLKLTGLRWVATITTRSQSRARLSATFSAGWGSTCTGQGSAWTSFAHMQSMHGSHDPPGISGTTSSDDDDGDDDGDDDDATSESGDEELAFWDALDVEAHVASIQKGSHGCDSSSPAVRTFQAACVQLLGAPVRARVINTLRLDKDTPHRRAYARRKTTRTTSAPGKATTGEDVPDIVRPFVERLHALTRLLGPTTVLQLVNLAPTVLRRRYDRIAANWVALLDQLQAANANGVAARDPYALASTMVLRHPRMLLGKRVDVPGRVRALAAALSLPEILVWQLAVRKPSILAASQQSPHSTLKQLAHWCSSAGVPGIATSVPIAVVVGRARPTYANDQRLPAERVLGWRMAARKLQLLADLAVQRHPPDTLLAALPAQLRILAFWPGICEGSPRGSPRQPASAAARALAVATAAVPDMRANGLASLHASHNVAPDVWLRALRYARACFVADPRLAIMSSARLEERLAVVRAAWSVNPPWYTEVQRFTPANLAAALYAAKEPVIHLQQLLSLEVPKVADVWGESLLRLLTTQSAAMLRAAVEDGAARKCDERQARKEPE